MNTIFESHIQKTDSCWLWTGAKSPEGYGRFRTNGRTVRVHRYAYEIYRSVIPKGMVIDHLCRVRSCVNPEHLEAVTQAENLYRGNTIAATNRAKTCCKNGHDFVTENTIISKRGQRTCRICTNLAKKKYRV